MARRYCPHCGAPLSRAANVCVQCETDVSAVAVPTVKRFQFTEYAAMAVVAVSCLAFVVSLGVTNLYRDGGWWQGVISLTCAAVATSYLKRSEH